MTEPIPCKHCGKPTDYLGTELCDPCWSVDSRVRLNPKLALKVLDEMGLTPKTEAEELLEWLHEQRGSLDCVGTEQCVVDLPFLDYEVEDLTPVDALRTAREARDVGTD